MTVIPKENSYINTHTHTHDSLTEDLLVIFLMGKKRKGKDSNWLFIFLTLRVKSIDSKSQSMDVYLRQYSVATGKSRYSGTSPQLNLLLCDK